ncbi:MAG TPA: AlkA N-terminal domain-containing protein [Gemmatimonadales bacterium]|nr:AlkA N-terminal domain-containing protein [Gemmatimonadales bacterium]
MLPADICQRALSARDARFDGIFFVGITTTKVYCRPVCPSRGAVPAHRRFFESPAAAEHAGFRPCLRCRPELAPGRALIDAVPRLAQAAVQRIGAGALNGHGVEPLARELGVSGRHLRRALQRAIGVSPLELAQTHRLLLAKRLLTDTNLPVTRIAFASGFRSVRRFNAAFRERYRLNPTALRPASQGGTSPDDVVRLALAYRAPLAWRALVACLARDALPGVEVASGGRYARTVRLAGYAGVIAVTDAHGPHVEVAVSSSLVPALMPLIARLRHVFDLDAEPRVIDAHLARAGLAPLVRRRPGLRLPGAMDGFEAVLRALLATQALRRRVMRALGEPIEPTLPGLTHYVPTAERVAAAGGARIAALGVSPRRAAVIAALARAIADGRLRLDPGTDVEAARRAVLEVVAVGEPLAMAIVAPALYWPDAFPAASRSPRDLFARAERWRPWRAYAALHLTLQHEAARDQDRRHVSTEVS